MGVIVLGLITVLLLFHHERARIADGKLVRVTGLGPIKVFSEYELARVRNPRLERSGGNDAVRVRFDYGEGQAGIGDVMPRNDAERLIGQLLKAMPMSAVGAFASTPDPPAMSPIAIATAPVAVMPATRAAKEATPGEAPRPRTLWTPSALALIAANLVPVAGVMLLGWGLNAIMVLFWAESAVIGCYTVLKMAIVGKLSALFSIPFFVAHYGIFMSVHFMFIDGMFVRGMSAPAAPGNAWTQIASILLPVWPALAALFVSHGVSFALNFLVRREFESETVSGLMGAPYKRIIVMQFTLIFGGWMTMMLKTPLPALMLLVALKMLVDLRSHRREHGIEGRRHS